MKKLTLHSELLWILSLVILSFSVAMTAAADLGLSMVVAPAYMKLGVLTFGQCEYLAQGVLFLLMCLLLRRIKPIYFVSFFTCVVYGLLLDGWRSVIPMFDPGVTAPGSMSMELRVVFFAAGLVLCALSIAMGFNSYIYPQVYDFFVKAVSDRFSIRRDRFKTGFDMCFLALACAMSLLFFRRFQGVGVGTIITTLFNGLLIGFFGRLIDKRCRVVPIWPGLEKRFQL